MEPERDNAHIETDAARGASTPHVVRWVLIVGLILAIAALTIIWVTGALSQGDIEEERTVSGIVEDRYQDDTSDIILSEDADEIENAPEIGNAEDRGAEDRGSDVIQNDTEEDAGIGR